MANKPVLWLLLLLLSAGPVRAELLKLSLLKKAAPVFAVKRDIFNGELPAGGDSRPDRARESQPAQADVHRTIAEEIAQSVSYEGFVIKDGKNSALLNISGEFFMVGEGDQVLEKIRILSIGRSRVTIEYEGLPYDIKIKGDEND